MIHHSSLMEKLYKKLSLTSNKADREELGAQIRAEHERLLQWQADLAADQEKESIPLVTQLVGFSIHEVMKLISERFKPKARYAIRSFSFYDRENASRVTITIVHDPDTMPCATHGVQPIVLIDPDVPERGMRCELCLAEILEKEGPR